MTPPGKKLWGVPNQATIVWSGFDGRSAARACSAGSAKRRCHVLLRKRPGSHPYEETGSGFPLLLIAGGGLNSTISGLNNPFNAIQEFKGEYRCIASDLRNAGA